MFKISTKTYLILLIALFKLNTCALVNAKLNRPIRSSQTSNQEASQTDDKYLLDKFEKYDKLKKIDKLQINEQNSNSILTSFNLNENVEEDTKNVIYWTPDNCKFLSFLVMCD